MSSVDRLMVDKGGRLELPPLRNKEFHITSRCPAKQAIGSALMKKLGLSIYEITTQRKKLLNSVVSHWCRLV